MQKRLGRGGGYGGSSKVSRHGTFPDSLSKHSDRRSTTTCLGIHWPGKILQPGGGN